MTQRSPLLRLFPILLLNITAFAIAIPVLPALAMDLGGSAVDVGLLYAMQSFGQFVMAPVWGSFSDRFGRKRILVATMIAAAVTEVLTAFTPSLLLLYLSRLIVGLCAGNVATATALIADATDMSRRSKGMAIVGISFGIGFTLGPAIGAGIGFLSEPGAGIYGSGLPFAAAGALNLITALIAAIVLIEPAKNTLERRTNRLSTRPVAIRRHLQNKTILTMCMLFFLYTVAITVMEGTFFVYMAAQYDYNMREVGLLFAAMGLLTAFTQGAIGPISRALGDRKMVASGIILLAIGLFFAPWFHRIWILLIFLAIATIGRALIHPGILSMTSKATGADDHTGQVMGILQSSSSLGRIVGPALGGLIFAYIHIDMPFIIAAIIITVAGVIWWHKTASADRNTDSTTP